ncbi:MAG: hypothetical protein HC921_15710 [Synechococcaceae cyanobacterium SM2_3_1]|nr:hypothetical protein [Synechococcaceae cyanobacterium SM2_3_1]
MGTFVKEAESVIDLRVGNTVLTTTEDHPFWVTGQGWVKAQDLHVGSVLQKLTGSTVVVEAIERRKEEVRIYNLDVAGFDTFFVSDMGILVHNACEPPKKAPEGRAFPDRPLPRDMHGNPIPESNAPHTQLGTKSGRKGKYSQAREFDANGNPVRDIDFTNHGRPEHPNPHQHRYLPNETGGTPRRGPTEPLQYS